MPATAWQTSAQWYRQREDFYCHPFTHAQYTNQFRGKVAFLRAFTFQGEAENHLLTRTLTAGLRLHAGIEQGTNDGETGGQLVASFFILNSAVPFFHKKHKCLINKSLQTLGYVRKFTYFGACEQ
ncbi:MAG: hypothetical protein RRZ65_10925 [Tannerellaceae bacterium]